MQAKEKYFASCSNLWGVENARQFQITDHMLTEPVVQEEHRHRGYPSHVEMKALRPVIHQDWLPAFLGHQWCQHRKEPYDLAYFVHFSSWQDRVWSLNHLTLFFNGFMQASRLNCFIDCIFF